MRLRDQRRPVLDLEQRLAEAAPEEPAVRLREQRLGDLVALVLDEIRPERVLPGLDPAADMGDACLLYTSDAADE